MQGFTAMNEIYYLGMDGREFKSPTLIQRLQAPRGAANPFTGEVQMGPEAIELLRNVMSFDYMGAHEFENGNTRKAMAAMYDGRADLVIREIEVDVAKPEDTLCRKFNAEAPAKKTQTVYIICPSAHAEKVEAFVHQLGQMPRKEEIAALKRTADFRENIFSDSEFHPSQSPVIGWFDIKNRFFFFTDRQMFEGTAKIFNIALPGEKAPEAVSAPAPKPQSLWRGLLPSFLGRG